MWCCQSARVLCQLWYHDSEYPILSSLEKTKLRGEHVHTNLRQCLLSCDLPKTHQNRIPDSVSLVEKPCDTATNHLKVIYNKPKEEDIDEDTRKRKKRFAVCSKGHTFPDMDKSVNIIEWIEVLRSLGADVFIYHYEMHPNISKVLDYYSSRDLVDVTEVTIPGTDFNSPFVQFSILMGNYNKDR